MNKQELKKVLWDIDRDKIDTLPADFVVQRILSYGGIFLIIKSMREYGKNTVKRVFVTMKPTSISPRKYFYLKNFLLS
ncbi:MAG: hypothetical protein HZB12_00635 [Candidatus Yonathbacteria bacterium]|nr:hypothetical protein [Candidatus Yonathbacteria bacterium]